MRRASMGWVTGKGDSCYGTTAHTVSSVCVFARDTVAAVAPVADNFSRVSERFSPVILTGNDQRKQGRMASAREREREAEVTARKGARETMKTVRDSCERMRLRDVACHTRDTVHTHIYI